MAKRLNSKSSAAPRACRRRTSSRCNHFDWKISGGALQSAPPVFFCLCHRLSRLQVRHPEPSEESAFCSSTLHRQSPLFESRRPFTDFGGESLSTAASV